MKLEIYNFGPIHHVELDLDKDVQFIYGENSVGKSYAMYCLYLLVKHFLPDEPAKRPLLLGLPSSLTISPNAQIVIDKIIALAQESKEPVAIGEFLSPVLENVITEIFLPDFEQSLLATFQDLGLLRNNYANATSVIVLTIPGYSLTFHINRNSVSVSATVTRQFDVNVRDIGEIIRVSGLNKIYISIGLDSDKDDIAQYLSYHLLYDITERFVTQISAIHFLPSSRSGLYIGLNGLNKIFADLSRIRSQIKRSFEIPSISEPAADYYLRLSTINTHLNNNESLHDISNKLERLLGGRVHFNKASSQVLFQPDAMNGALELSQASSMVAELAPVVAYIRYALNTRKGQAPVIIIFEEPEAHLHPKIQVELMQLFVELAQNGVKLFITSHSNYMFNALGNLVLKGDIDESRVAAYHFVMSEKGSIDARDMIITKDEIQDNNFALVSEALYDERLRIYDMLNEQYASTDEPTDAHS